MSTAERVALRYQRASRLMKPPLKRAEMEELVENIVGAARENARATDGVGVPDRSKPYDLEWEARVDHWIGPSIESILESIQGRDCQDYGLEKPLNARQLQEVKRLCRARNRY